MEVLLQFVVSFRYEPWLLTVFVVDIKCDFVIYVHASVKSSAWSQQLLSDILESTVVAMNSHHLPYSSCPIPHVKYWVWLMGKVELCLYSWKPLSYFIVLSTRSFMLYCMTKENEWWGEGKHLCWLLNASCIPFSCLFSLIYCFSKSHVNITDLKQKKQGGIPDVSRDMYIPVQVESFEVVVCTLLCSWDRSKLMGLCSVVKYMLYWPDWRCYHLVIDTIWNLQSILWNDNCDVLIVISMVSYSRTK